MKKTKLFSRIFAAALAAVVTATTLITNSGAGLPAFAEGNEGGDGKYKVTIVSPDVPSTGTYTYKFYRIIQGEVEENDGKNIIANAQWGDAFGSTFTTDEILIAHQDADEENSVPEKDLKLTKDQILITSFDGNVKEDKNNYSNVTGPDAFRPAFEAINNLHTYFADKNSGLYGTYGGTSSSLNTAGRFHYGTSNKEFARTAAGFTQMLNKYMTDSSTLKAFTDLLYNGIPAGKASDVQPEIKFLDPAYSPTEVDITGADELTVRVEPGYYLIACVDETGRLTNDGKTTPKPVSAMLLLVGPNEKANTIVGKNTTSVATVDLKMFYKTTEITPIGDGDTDVLPAYGNNVRNKMTWSSTSEDILNEDNWLDRVSFGNLQRTLTYRDASPNAYTVPPANYVSEVVLYRVDITLPENFESYEDVGYFLAVLGDWDGAGGGQAGKYIQRAQSCRPLIYVKHKGDDAINKIGEIGYDPGDEAAKAGFAIGAKNNNYNVQCVPISYKSIYIENNEILADEIMYLGDLFNKDVYGEGTAPAEGEEDDRIIPFKGGDHIYIYFPAFFWGDRITDDNRLTMPAHAWAVYSNNPHSTATVRNGQKGSISGGFTSRYQINGHVNVGDVGISSVSETNINTYALNVHVGGEGANGDKNFDQNNSFYTLYRFNDEGEKEYALLYRPCSINTKSYCAGWYTIDRIKEYFGGYDIIDGEGENAKIKVGSNRISDNSRNGTYDLNFMALDEVKGKDKDGKDITVSYKRTIDGLAPGTYYIEELAITNGNGTLNTDRYHYKLATKPFELVVGQKYNLDKNLPSATPFDVANKNYLIGELSVDFDQLETKDRTISAEILKPVPNEGATDASKNSVLRNLTATEAATDDGIVEVLITHKSEQLIWLPETGGIGTTIFFIIGGTIVVAATVLIVTRFRIKRERL